MMMDDLPQKHIEDPQESEIIKCIICGTDICEHLGKKTVEGRIKKYCCFHVPRKYRRKSVDKYACEPCKEEMGI